MGYRIDYQAREGVLAAIVSGKSKYAARIARDLAAHAGERELLIDLRRLEDRVGNLGTLVGTIGSRRIAVLDVAENDRYYVFAEMLARSLGCTLRLFADAQSAIRWLSRK
ncbi:hypothetical protein AYO46_10120 [Betaproteobacteria bacterium SCGC AG-212-J23]|nr:hypothetical protein AYO46_10120 [Betaproteobacteria bacterium SCGC AG-212-J23]